MRKYCLFLLVVLAACGSSTKENVQNHSKSDTLQINGKVYYLDSISEKEFQSIKIETTTEKDAEVIDDSNVKREGTKLSFHLPNGTDSVFVNEESEYLEYKFVRSLPEINCWLVKYTPLEDGDYLLINKATANTIHICGIPIFSSDKKHFVALFWQETKGWNLQLFKVVDKKPILVFNEISHEGHKLFDFYVVAVGWKNDSTIYLELQKTEVPENTPNQKTYKKLVIN